MCLWALAFIFLITRGQLGVTSYHQECVDAWTRKIKRGWFLGIWKLIPLAIWWSTWKERNQRIFAGKARSYQDSKLYFLRTLYSWSHVLGNGTHLKLLDFVDEISIESMRA